MSDRAAFIRESMRRSWGGRTAQYAAATAGNNDRYAAVLLELVGPRPGERVLDVATGPGVVAVPAALAVGPAGQVVATDLAPEWEEVVAGNAAKAGAANVAFRASSADALDLPDGSFDVALCQFGLMFVPEPVQALREMRRVLRDDGRLGAVVWSTADRVPLFSATGPLLQPYLPPPAPSQELPTPLSLGAPGLIERLVAEAGFRDVRSERRTLDFVLPDPEERWRADVIDGQPAAREAVAALSEAERRALHDRYVAALEPYRREGAIRLPCEAIFVTAVK
ncbi:MAG TPA: methyltransferase domain-containing protein [Chloroflexota bacterium]